MSQIAQVRLCNKIVVFNIVFIGYSLMVTNTSVMEYVAIGQIIAIPG